MCISNKLIKYYYLFPVILSLDLPRTRKLHLLIPSGEPLELLIKGLQYCEGLVTEILQEHHQCSVMTGVGCVLFVVLRVSPVGSHILST